LVRSERGGCRRPRPRSRGPLGRAPVGGHRSAIRRSRACRPSPRLGCGRAGVIARPRRVRDRNDHVRGRPGPFPPAGARPSDPPPSPGRFPGAHAPPALDRADRRPVARGPRAGPEVEGHALPRAIARATMAVGLPTSTAAFQMASMFGVRPDIPAFHYYDRARRGDIHFPRRGHAGGSRPGRRRAGAASCRAGARTAASSPAARTTTSSASRVSRGPLAEGSSAPSRPSWWSPG
jgi:hypothetical protein